MVPAGAVVRVLEPDQSRPAFGRRPGPLREARLDLLGRQVALLALEQPQHRAVEAGDRRDLVGREVRGGIGDDRLAGLRPQPDGDLVGERARRQEQRVLEAEQFGCLAAQGRFLDVVVAAESWRPDGGVAERLHDLGRQGAEHVTPQVAEHGATPA